MSNTSTGHIKVKSIQDTAAPYGLYTTYITQSDKELKGSVLVLHGMQEHSGRYIQFAEYLASVGFAVLLYDHIGHGNTATDDTAQGYFQQERPQERLINDAIALHHYLKDKHPDHPHFIIGHSMGSFITRCVLQRIGNEFDGSIWIGTGAKTPGAEAFRALLALLQKISPRKRSKLINGIFSKMNNTKFRHEPDFDDTSWLSLSKTNRKRFQEDPLCGIPFTNNAFYTLLTILLTATKKGWQHSIPKSLPILLVSGQDDPIGGFSKGIEKTEKQLKESGFQEVDIITYPKKRHEILQEENSIEVFEAIAQWLLSHAKLHLIQ
ncbi:alpha/beta fold hydrolase [Sphingobacterium paucimobilis]|uniref:Serine aminopeptidase S33 domain-containing protein n=1 Tax=Sphingobacterium paucimobilis HER1398 TaxID=1346330 RepID=U2HQG5_9SPHI|nr:alpha/beta hydrolase [Sphingobacterium paucimobilis]ERJ57515.1 hypothetical protein M472_01920 [Sphingobacterium paucimobilis HER1398]